MVDVRRLKMLQMVQLFKCEEDASQVSEHSCVGNRWVFRTLES